MGNSVCVCFHQNTKSSSVKIIFWEGNAKIINGKHVAGEIMFESPDKMVFHADSFFIGHPVPALAVDDQLMPGQTYFVLPIEIFSRNVLTASSLAKLITRYNKWAAAAAAGAAAAPINITECPPFEYMKGENNGSRVLIKVMPEFLTRLISRGQDSESAGNNNNNPSSYLLCSTPELKKHYDKLVGSREHVWSPKLETISEQKFIKLTPSRFLG